MKLLISNQHGAVVMALMPFLYGMLLSEPIGLHFFLLLAWASAYLFTYPFLSLFKGRNLELYQKWSLIYGGAAVVFSLPAIWHNWHIIFFTLVMFPLLLVSIHYTKTKNERAFLNDLNGIVIFAIAGMCAYYFSARQFDVNIWLVALYPSLFFIGTTLYVKSVMRERKNPLYLKLSIGFHLVCVLVFLSLQQYILTFAFVLPLIRAIYLPSQKLSVMQVGLTEVALSLVFFLMLLYATL